MKLKGRIRASIPQGGRKFGVILEVTDIDSGIGFMQAEISLEDWTLMQVGSRTVGCDLDLRGLSYVGLQRLHKRFVLVIGERLKGITHYKAGATEELKRIGDELLEEQHGDGWKISSYADLTNPHRYTEGPPYGHAVNIGIEKWVKKEEKDAA